MRLSGSGAALRSARERIGGMALEADAGERMWRDLREQAAAFFQGPGPLWRFSLPSTAAPLGLAGAQLVEWGGALRWLRALQPAAEIRARARALGGHATLFRGGDRAQNVFEPLAPGIAAIHQRLRAQFDPAGIFDAGRLLPQIPHADTAR